MKTALWPQLWHMTAHHASAICRQHIAQLEILPDISGMISVRSLCGSSFCLWMYILQGPGQGFTFKMAADTPLDKVMPTLRIS